MDGYVSECPAAVILATKDEEADGRWQPPPNVLHKIGLAQQKFNNRVICLKDTRCEFPSNVQPKVWEHFTQENCDGCAHKNRRRTVAGCRAV